MAKHIFLSLFLLGFCLLLFINIAKCSSDSEDLKEIQDFDGYEGFNNFETESEVSPTTIVQLKDNMEIDMEVIDSLKPNKWLFGEAVDYAVTKVFDFKKILPKAERFVYVFPQMTTAIMDNPGELYPDCEINSMDLKNKIVLLPYNYSNIHWQLFICNTQKKTFEFYDPLTPDLKTGDKPEKYLATFLTAMKSRNEFVPNNWKIDTKNWKLVENPSIIIEQQSPSDCGIYVIKVIDNLLNGEFRFSNPLSYRRFIKKAIRDNIKPEFRSEIPIERWESGKSQATKIPGQVIMTKRDMNLLNNKKGVIITPNTFDFIILNIIDQQSWFSSGDMLSYVNCSIASDLLQNPKNLIRESEFNKLELNCKLIVIPFSHKGKWAVLIADTFEYEIHYYDPEKAIGHKQKIISLQDKIMKKGGNISETRIYNLLKLFELRNKFVDDNEVIKNKSWKITAKPPVDIRKCSLDSVICAIKFIDLYVNRAFSTKYQGDMKIEFRDVILQAEIEMEEDIIKDNKNRTPKKKIISRSDSRHQTRLQRIRSKGLRRKNSMKFVRNNKGHNHKI